MTRTNSNQSMETCELASLVRRKRLVLEQLQAICERQRGLIESGETQRLLRVLTAKQKLLNGLQAIERLLDPYREQDPETRGWVSEEAREACRRDVAACTTIWAGLLELEQRCGAMLETRRGEVAAQLTQVQGAANVRSAYLNSHAPLPSQLDLQAE